MENKAHALAAGAFVMVVAALLVALAWWLSREGGVRQNYELSSSTAVTGLSLQAAVRFKGVPVGKVTSMVKPISANSERSQPNCLIRNGAKIEVM